MEIKNIQKPQKMKKLTSLLFLVALFAGTNSFAQSWKIDAAHSKVGFTAKYLVISDVEGQFKDFTGTVMSAKPDWSDLSIEASINVNSITTDNEMRDKHLKSDDFFNAEKFPTIHFKSTGVKALGNNKFVLIGDLTIRDVTKHVELPLVYGGTVKDSWGNTKAGFKTTGTINRKDFGLKYRDAAATGEAVVGDDVDFTINVVVIKQSI